jgi:hypothetical protein
MGARLTPEQRRVQQAQKTGRALLRAAHQLSKYRTACRDCGEELRMDDDRILTGERCQNLGSFLVDWQGSPS